MVMSKESIVMGEYKIDLKVMYSRNRSINDYK